MQRLDGNGYEAAEKGAALPLRGGPSSVDVGHRPGALVAKLQVNRVTLMQSIPDLGTAHATVGGTRTARGQYQ